MIYDFLYLKRPFTHLKIPFMESFILKIQKVAFSLPSFFSSYEKSREYRIDRRRDDNQVFKTSYSEKDGG